MSCTEGERDIGYGGLVAGGEGVEEGNGIGYDAAMGNTFTSDDWKRSRVDGDLGLVG